MLVSDKSTKVFTSIGHNCLHVMRNRLFFGKVRAAFGKLERERHPNFTKKVVT